MDDKKKKQLLWYINYNIKKVWEIFPEYEDTTKTYAEFKAAIISYYLEASGSLNILYKTWTHLLESDSK